MAPAATVSARASRAQPPDADGRASLRHARGRGRQRRRQGDLDGSAGTHAVLRPRAGRRCTAQQYDAQETAARTDGDRARRRALLLVRDSLDFWRVEEIEPGRLLRLRAEMRLPGLAWLEMYADTDDEGRTRYRQRALFHPRGLPGHAYWWSVAPFHAVVFGGMARNITQAASKGMSAHGADTRPGRESHEPARHVRRARRARRLRRG
ncbi:hypothetical protein SHIRM173S_05938 [Streptomyces hirsutus]